MKMLFWFVLGLLLIIPSILLLPLWNPLFMFVLFGFFVELYAFLLFLEFLEVIPSKT